MSDEFVPLREYRVPRNGSVDCTAGPEDDFVVGRLEAPLRGVRRLDLLTLNEHGNTETRQQDVPYVADSDAVVLAPGIDKLRAAPAFTLRLRMLAVDDCVERALGDYIFNHTPYAS